MSSTAQGPGCPHSRLLVMGIEVCCSGGAHGAGECVPAICNATQWDALRSLPIAHAAAPHSQVVPHTCLTTQCSDASMLVLHGARPEAGTDN